MRKSEQILLVSCCKKIILDAGISSNPDEYMYDILWGESGSRIVRDEEGVEENEAREERRWRRWRTSEYSIL